MPTRGSLVAGACREASFAELAGAALSTSA
jgi:hypothetical protein